ncbi:MAG: hypothetical protein LBF78_08695 [Treponema sp.]|jgi:hypothetical protein|nr:hypothetical protein [Treponema sp.]
MSKFFFLNLAFCFFCLSAFTAAQENSETGVQAGGARQADYIIPEPEKRPLAPENPEALPKTFRKISLGMSLEDLKAGLKADGLFGFRGDRDVSFLPVREETLIESAGPDFISRSFFQLAQNKVFIMAFLLNTALIDHYSVFTAFVKKYGEPKTLSPKESVWENDEVRISIERPLTVKYIDKIVFNQLIEESEARESGRLKLQEDFLNEF